MPPRIFLVESRIHPVKCLPVGHAHPSSRIIEHGVRFPVTALEIMLGVVFKFEPEFVWRGLQRREFLVKERSLPSGLLECLPLGLDLGG
jgi:hypothetical protein